MKLAWNSGVILLLFSLVYQSFSSPLSIVQDDNEDDDDEEEEDNEDEEKATTSTTTESEYEYYYVYEDDDNSTSTNSTSTSTISAIEVEAKSLNETSSTSMATPEDVTLEAQQSDIISENSTTTKNESTTHKDVIDSTTAPTTGDYTAIEELLIEFEIESTSTDTNSLSSNSTGQSETPEEISTRSSEKIVSTSDISDVEISSSPIDGDSTTDSADEVVTTTTLSTTLSSDEADEDIEVATDSEVITTTATAEIVDSSPDTSEKVEEPSTTLLSSDEVDEDIEVATDATTIEIEDPETTEAETVAPVINEEPKPEGVDDGAVDAIKQIEDLLSAALIPLMNMQTTTSTTMHYDTTKAIVTMETTTVSTTPSTSTKAVPEDDEEELEVAFAKFSTQSPFNWLQDVEIVTVETTTPRKTTKKPRKKRRTTTTTTELSLDTSTLNSNPSGKYRIKKKTTTTTAATPINPKTEKEKVTPKLQTFQIELAGGNKDGSNLKFEINLQMKNEAEARKKIEKAFWKAFQKFQLEKARNMSRSTTTEKIYITSTSAPTTIPTTTTLTPSTSAKASILDEVRQEIEVPTPVVKIIRPKETLNRQTPAPPKAPGFFSQPFTLDFVQHGIKNVTSSWVFNHAKNAVWCFMFNYCPDDDKPQPEQWKVDPDVSDEQFSISVR